MEKQTYEFILEARQPVAHSSGTEGNESVAMRQKVRQPDGRMARVPIITGDTMRHGLREAAALATLDAAGLLHAEAHLSEAAIRLLFSGGMLSGKGNASQIKLDRYRELVDLFPPLALFGGCTDNRCIPGALQIGPAILVCQESVRLLDMDGWAAGQAGTLATHRSHVESVTRVRMDPMLSPEKRRMLTADDATRVEQKLLTNENASGEGDHKAKAGAASSMMPRNHETIVAGSLFYWQTTATTWTDLERDCWVTTLATFLADAHVGGKRGTGHGHLVPKDARHITFGRPSYAAEAVNPNGLAARAGAVYRAHVQARADDLREWLCRTVDA